ncbi:MAG: M23 family metallopeptidase [Eubacteriales bacterium]
MATIKGIITSRFGDTKGRVVPHKGVDTAFGVYAVADGLVVGVRNDIPNTHTGMGVNTAELGNYIKIQHADGYLTMHAHLNFGSPIDRVGSKVTRGQYLGTAGNTGQSSGCHEHFQVECNGVPIDPMAVYEGRLALRAPAAPTVNTGGLKVGDAVTVKANSKWTNGAAVAAFVYAMRMYVTSVDGNSGTAVISTSKSGAATGRISVGSLTKV